MKKKLKSLATKMYQKGFNAFKDIKKDEKLILFESFNGRQYSDSPRAIYEYMKEHHPEYKMVWSVDRRFTQNFEGLPQVKRMSLEWIKMMNKSKYWVTNSRMPLWIDKSKETVYVQTWHGTPLKRLGLDMDEVKMPGTNTEKYKENFKKEAAKWDYLIAPNRFSKEIFKRAFGYEGEMIDVGYPRNDYLIENKNNKEEIERIKERLGIQKNKKVILYAPTWRDDEFYGKGRYKFNLTLDIHQLKEQYGDEAVLLLRTHYLVAQNMKAEQYGDFVIDMSNHGDIKELYLASDMLITDYSSVFFDYSLLERPILFFAYDLEKYREELRGFYFDYEQLAPGSISQTNEELFADIEKVFKGEYTINKEKKEFIAQFAEWESGESTKKVVETFLKEVE